MVRDRRRRPRWISTRSMRPTAQDGRSRPAYEPSMMVALVLYAYARGVRSAPRDRAGVRGGRGVPGDRGAAAARSRDDRAVRRAPRAGAGGRCSARCSGSARRPGWRASASSRSTARRSTPTPVATRRVTTSGSRGRSSRRPRRSTPAEDELYGDARGDELPPELCDAPGPARSGCARPSVALMTNAPSRPADPALASRSGSRSQSGGLEEELWTECRGQQGL